MAIQIPNAVTIIPKTQSSAGSVKNFAQRLRGHANENLNAPEQRAALAAALENLQNQIDPILNALRGGLPFPDPLQITDSSGTIVGMIGTVIGPTDRKVYFTIWLGGIWLGGTGPGTPDSAFLTTTTGGDFFFVSGASFGGPVDITGDLTVTGDETVIGNADVGSLSVSAVPGATVTVTLAKLTGGGANGSLTFASGVLTSVTPPT